MRFRFFYFLLLMMSSLTHAAEITWNAPEDITGQISDFDTLGSPVLFWNAGNETITIDPQGLNLTFTSGPKLANDVYNNIDPHNRGGDNNYEQLLASMTWATATESISLTGLTVGHIYRLQLWMADTRTATQGRRKTYDSGDGTSQVILDSGPPSQHVIGIFTADATTQTLRFVGGSDSTHPQYNALALRDIGLPTPIISLYQATAHGLSSEEGVAIQSGESVTLSWNITNADSVTLTPDQGVVAASGSTIVNPTTTTTYTLTATNSYGNSQQSITLYVSPTVLPLRLNEIVSSNSDGLEDEDGDAEDWIEIYNPNPFVTDAGGYSLTDDPMLIQTWPIPSQTPVPAHGYIILFASGKNRTVPELHTHFKLDSQGDYLALLNTVSNEILQQWPTDYPTTTNFPAIPTDRSYGYDSEGLLLFFNTPTPGQLNGSSVLGFVGDTQFSHKRGFYETGFNLTITSVSPGASIRYTTDGTPPTDSTGNLYTTPISISQTTVIRAIAYQDGYEPTNIDTQTYLFAADIIASAVMDTAITQDATYGPQMADSLKALPVISLVIEDADTMDNSSEHRTSVEMFFADGTQGFQVDAGTSHFGGYFTDFAKKNFRLYFRKQYGPGKLHYPLFDGFEHGLAPVEEFDALDLRTGSHDMAMRGAYMSNRFTDDTMLEMGQLSPHGRFVHLILNGVYWGQYHLRERWNASMAAEYFGGEKDNYEAINGNANVGGWSPGVAYDGDGSGWETIKTIAAGGTPWSSLPSRVDLENYLDFILLYDFGSSENEYRSVLEPRDIGLKMLTYLNDADGYLNPTGIAQNNGTGGPGNLLGYLHGENHTDFKIFLADLIYQHYFHDGVFTPAQNIARLQKRVAETRLSFLSESARWGYRTPSSWLDYQNNLIDNQFPTQTESRLSDLRQKGWYPSVVAPEFNQNGGVVSPGFGVSISNINPGGGLVYYTIDGTDPRLPGGAINPIATGIPGNSSGFTMLVSIASSWKYLDNGSNQGVAWRASGFDDSSWAEGMAQLGYGDGDESTQLSYGGDGNNKYITSYFRKKFTASDVTTIQALTLNLMRDDGAVVYLNGQEVVRSNMPLGTVTSSTIASTAIGSGDESAFTQFTLDPALLTEGENLLAVEIHQANITSSDISFDLNLTATSSDSSPDITLSENTQLNARVLINGTWSALHPARFIVSQTPIAPLPGHLAISELHYHPSNPTTTELAAMPLLTDDDFEFIELINIHSQPLRLDGCLFSDGIDYVFPEDSILQPAARLIVVRNSMAFALRHSQMNMAEVFGDYSGGLKNSGERIALENASGVLLIDLTYGDGSDRGGSDDLLWPSSPDGSGTSLVLIYPASGIDPNHPMLWRSSISPDGTPGQGGPNPLPDDPGIDRDGDGSPALLEMVLNANDDDPSLQPWTRVQLELFDVGGGDLRKFLTLTFTRDTTVEASLHILTSSDLANWHNNAILLSREFHVDGTETLRYRYPAPRDETTQFMRVKVQN